MLSDVRRPLTPINWSLTGDYDEQIHDKNVNILTSLEAMMRGLTNHCDYKGHLASGCKNKGGDS